MKEGKKYEVLGCMSGTSLDGIDLAFCSFIKKEGKIDFDISYAETIPYTREWKSRLESASGLAGRELFYLDHYYGIYLGEQILSFIKKNDIHPRFISSHGHTVFHEPDNAGSLQIGNGHNIFAVTDIPVITDFRNMDIALGGQGAPLVPAGDEYLFPQYDYCLNLGGFSNISFKVKGRRIAYDICPVNTIINDLARREGYEIDRNGELARKGSPSPELVKALNSLEFYGRKYPKSLGREFLENEFYPVLNNYKLPVRDLLASVYSHISEMIAACIDNHKKPSDLVIPDDKIVDFKEALIFAFLGVLKTENLNNCLASVTGASKDSSGGIVYGNIDMSV